MNPGNALGKHAGSAGKDVVVVSLGGSVLYSGSKFDRKKAGILAAALHDASARCSLIVVVGGGALARKRVEKARAEGKSEFEADLAAIAATRANALKFAGILPDSVFAGTFRKGMAELGAGKIVVSCGMMPGLTTDSVSVLFAELARAKRVVNVSNVDGIYAGDPAANPRSQKYARLSHEQLTSLAVKFDSRKARENFVFDLVACKLAGRSRIPVYFVSAANPAEIGNAIAGRSISGTVVTG